jgi:hypothetical protein
MVKRTVAEGAGCYSSYSGWKVYGRDGVWYGILFWTADSDRTGRSVGLNFLLSTGFHWLNSHQIRYMMSMIVLLSEMLHVFFSLKSWRVVKLVKWQPATVDVRGRVGCGVVRFSG